MSKACLPLACATMVLATLASPALAADEALGTLTVKGKTTKLAKVYAVTQANEQDDEYLIVLLTDREVAPADRVPARLQELAAAGKVQGLRLLWRTAYDDLRWVPYHPDLSDNGLASEGVGILDLAEFNPHRVEGKVSSKMLGQDWHFNVSFKAAIVHGGELVIERLAELEEPPLPREDPTAGKHVEADPATLKRRLGKLGFEFKPEAFTFAVKDANLEAVELFLTLGMSPDTKDSGGLPVVMYACMYCQHDSPSGREAVALALIAAKANVNVKDDNDSTPLIWSIGSCGPEVVQALIDAGANVNARAKGGATALMLAKAMQRDDLVPLLEQAGAKE